MENMSLNWKKEGHTISFGVKLLRAVLTIQCVITLVFGIVLLCFGAVALNRQILVEMMGKWVGGVVTAFGLFIVLTSIFGFWGTKSMNRVVFKIYAALLVLECLVVMIMGIAVLASGDQVVADMKEHCDEKPYLHRIQDAYDRLYAFKAACQQPTVDLCEGYSSKFGEDDAATFINLLETQEDCSGFCTTKGYVFRSTVNVTLPAEPCVTVLAGSFKSGDVGGAFLGISIALLLTISIPIYIYRQDRSDDIEM